MSLVDYASARRATPAAGRRALRIQPGLWLAWLVLLLAAGAAIAPTLFTHYSATEGISGAQRLAPQAGHWLGTA
ncbi:MAG: ABC transporter permease, partial [Pantoea piersonii]